MITITKWDINLEQCTLQILVNIVNSYVLCWYSNYLPFSYSARNKAGWCQVGPSWTRSIHSTQEVITIRSKCWSRARMDTRMARTKLHFISATTWRPIIPLARTSSNLFSCMSCCCVCMLVKCFFCCCNINTMHSNTA